MLRSDSLAVPVVAKESPEDLRLETQAWKAAIAQKPFGIRLSNKLTGTEWKLVRVHYKVSVNAPEESSEGPTSGVRLRTRKICRWRDSKMVLRWAADELLMTEQNFCKIISYQGPWMLKADLDRKKLFVQQEVY